MSEEKNKNQINNQLELLIEKIREGQERTKNLKQIKTTLTNINNNNNKAIARKVNEIFISKDVLQCNKVNYKNVNYNILGLDTVPKVELSIQEENQIKSEVNKLQIVKETKTRFGSTQIGLEIEDKVLLEGREKLFTLMESYTKKLVECEILLKELTNKRLVDFPELCKRKLEEAEVNSNLNRTKMSLISRMLHSDIFNENEIALEAYKTFRRHLRDDAFHCKKEIQDLLELKGKYEAVSDKDYEDVLKKYLYYTERLELFKDLHTKLKKDKS